MYSKQNPVVNLVLYISKPLLQLKALDLNVMKYNIYVCVYIQTYSINREKHPASYHQIKR